MFTSSTWTASHTLASPASELVVGVGVDFWSSLVLGTRTFPALPLCVPAFVVLSTQLISPAHSRLLTAGPVSSIWGSSSLLKGALAVL